MADFSFNYCRYSRCVFFKHTLKVIIPLLWVTCAIDVQMSVDNHNLSKEFNKTFGYHKSPVNFESLQHLKDCKYRGGQIK